MSARYRLQARPAPVATLPPRGGPQCVRFSMARSVRFSVAVDTRRYLIAMLASDQRPVGVACLSAPSGGNSSPL